MDDVFGVQVLQTFYYFVDEKVDQGRLESVFVSFDEVQEVVLEVFEDEIDLAFLFEGLLNSDHEVTFEHFKHLDLPLYGFA